MRHILNLMISKLKKGKYTLDEHIAVTDLISITYRRLIPLIRGLIKRIGLKKCGRIVFFGKSIKLYSKRLIKLGNGVTLGNYVELDALSSNGITIGNNSKLGDYSIIRCTGSLKKIGKGVKIGNNFGAGDYCFFGAAGGISIGDDVIMGQNVRFHSENHNFERTDIPIHAQGVNNKGIIIGNDCWIGSGCVFLDAVEVGDGCVIGANTLVNKSIPAYSVAVGNPVRVINNRRKIQGLKA